MSFFNENSSFNYKLREYQQKALDEAHRYIQDDKINIVAAPGAGKTILALKLMLELGKPTLICVPSITLQQQWVQRLTSDFSNIDESIISDDLLNPKIVTICTYQALHSVVKTENHRVDIYKLLKEQSVSTVILDEAHHLKNSWWVSLVKLLKEFKDIKTISLTATPPYDVVGSEWKNYIELCGDIDVEITIPELVEKGDLCHHQDYVYLNYPTVDEVNKIQKQKETIELLGAKICNNQDFVTAISLHPGLIDIGDKVDLFLDNFEYYLSILSFLKFKQISIPTNEISIPFKSIPDFDIKQLEILLEGCLYFDKNSYKGFEEVFRNLKKELNQLGIIEESHVNLSYGEEIKKIIQQNKGKLDSINQIVESESRFMKDELKMVIISDYIREDIYEVEEFAEIKNIGVIPIFESIRRNLDSNINLAVLTGKLVIIPTELKERLLDICESEKLPSSLLTIQDLEYDFSYSKVLFSASSRKKMVHIITKLFETCDIQVLVGTSSLIGEGWDAPFVNTLILASFVGSFVLSNQMRGRAIRVNKFDNNKTANIWHLACVEQSSVENHYTLGRDFEILKRRFTAFDGTFLERNKIDYGIDRLGFYENVNSMSKEQIDEMNAKMLQKASCRMEMVAVWKEALKEYRPVRRHKVPIFDCYINERIRHFVLKKPNSGLIKYFVNAYNKIIDMNNVSNLKRVSKAVVNALYEMKVFPKVYGFHVQKEFSRLLFFLEDSTVKDNTLFKECIKEFLEDIENPRYLIRIRNRYFGVPSIIAKRKQNVMIFKKHVEKSFFGKTTIVFTKTPEMKKELLQIKLDML